MTKTKLIPIRNLKIKDGKLEYQIRFYPITIKEEAYNQEEDEFDDYFYR